MTDGYKEEAPALDDLDGDEAEDQAGEPVEPEHDLDEDLLAEQARQEAQA